MKTIIKTITKRSGRLPLAVLNAGHPRLAGFMQHWLSFGSRNPVRRRVLHFIRCSERLFELQRRAGSGADGGRDYPVVLINRDCDTRRLAAFQKRAQQFGVSFQRSPGVSATAPGFDFTPYESQIGETFYNQTRILKGGVGCFLGHLGAWRQVQAGGHELGLVCEDDAWFIGPPPLKIADLELPPDADLIFANERMAAGLLNEHSVAELKHHKFLKVAANAAFYALHKISSHITGPGGDGYFLTRRGVEKLLRIYSQTRIYVDVDWFLLFQSLSDAEVALFKIQDATGRFDSMVLAPERLCSYVLVPSLVEQASMGSTRKTEDPAGYLERSVMFPNPR